MKNILIVGAGKGIGLKSAELLRNENLYTISRTYTKELEDLDTEFFELDVAKDDLEKYLCRRNYTDLYFVRVLLI